MSEDKVQVHCDICGLKNDSPAYCWPQRFGKTVCIGCAGQIDEGKIKTEDEV